MTGAEDLQQLTIRVGGLVRTVSRCMVKHGDLILKPWLSSAVSVACINLSAFGIHRAAAASARRGSCPSKGPHLQ